MRRAKIIATIGPATESRDQIFKLMEAGMNVARLNFSHGDPATHARAISDIRECSKTHGLPVAIMQDLQGVKIRTGGLKNGEAVELETGKEFRLTTQEIEGTQEIVATSYEDLPAEVEKGDHILLSDGKIVLEVLNTNPGLIETSIVSGGRLKPRQGINIPGRIINAPALTQKDLEDLRFGIEHGVDFVALSFVRRAEDAHQLRRHIERQKADVPIIAKLEKPASIDNLKEILEACEGVMIARGDLGVEMPPEDVPIIQKRVIREANRHNKLVITATQMLESMVNNRRPSRAEASDVANAVLDGTDALMLSAETAIGHNPVEAVDMMARIIRRAERVFEEQPFLHEESTDKLNFPEAICDAAYHASTGIHARAIAAFTQSGSTAKLISKYRPPTEIFGFTPHPRILNRMCLYWGVTPMQMEEIDNVDELILGLERLLIQKELVKAGDNLIILTGAPIMERGHTSLMKLHSVTGASKGAKP